MKYYLLAGLFICLLGACGDSHAGHDHEHEAEEHEHSTEEHNHDSHKEGEESHHGSDEIVFSPEKAQAAGVQVITVERGNFRKTIPATGQILAAQGGESVIVSPVTGVVSFTHKVSEGMMVQRGMSLMNVSARDLQEGDPVRKARITYETAKEEYERAEKLVKTQILSKKEFNIIRENYENVRIAYEAVKPGKGNKGGASVTSNMSGYVKDCLVKEGDYVAVGQPLFTVSQTKRLTLRAEVSERYYAQLPMVETANFRTAYDGTVHRMNDLHGKLLSYGKTAGSNSYYIPVTFEFDNRGGIVPGSFVEVFLQSRVLPDVIGIPLAAVTEEQGLNFVYVQVDEECYMKREVKLGLTDGNLVEVLSGLSVGEQLVSSGAIHIKLASASNAIPAHTHNH